MLFEKVNDKGLHLVAPRKQFDKENVAEILDLIKKNSRGDAYTCFELSCFSMRAHFYFYPEEQRVDVNLHRYGNAKPVVKYSPSGRRKTVLFIGEQPVAEKQSFTLTDKKGKNAYKKYCSILVNQFVKANEKLSEEDRKKNPCFFNTIGHGGEYQTTMARIKKENERIERLEAKRKERLAKEAAAEKKRKAEIAQAELAKVRKVEVAE